MNDAYEYSGKKKEKELQGALPPNQMVEPFWNLQQSKELLAHGDGYWAAAGQREAELIEHGDPGPGHSPSMGLSQV